MQEKPQYLVGVDIGTTEVRCVIGHVEKNGENPTVVGVGRSPVTGMRKGVVSKLSGPSEAFETALIQAEQTSGHNVEVVNLNVNGTHIESTKVHGLIAMSGHEVGGEEVSRLEEVATAGKISQNRRKLAVIPYGYTLDGQENIKNPDGMTGTRLEVNANVVSGLEPHVVNLQKICDDLQVEVDQMMVSSMAAARAVLSERQQENGVAVLDIGGSTTGLSVYEEGELQYTTVIGMGGENITNDLAIGLQIDPEIANLVKLKHVEAGQRKNVVKVSVKHGRDLHSFYTDKIDEIVDARLDELFEEVKSRLKKCGKLERLPSGVVLTGGGANIKGLVEYVKHKLNMAVSVCRMPELGGIGESLKSPENAVVVGLMLAGMDEQNSSGQESYSHGKKSQKKDTNGFFAKMFKKISG